MNWIFKLTNKIYFLLSQWKQIYLAPPPKKNHYKNKSFT